MNMPYMIFLDSETEIKGNINLRTYLEISKLVLIRKLPQ